MSRRILSRLVLLLAFGIHLGLVHEAARASDHADPIGVKVPESDITDLFLFPDGDQLVVVLAVRPSLTGSGPYDVAPYEYRVYMDLHSAVSYDDSAARARFGGAVVSPAGIRPDVTLRVRLRSNGSLGEHSVEGLADAQGVRAWAGVRDDPFIFPRFFGKNALAMVVSIPRTAFPPGQQDWILWGATVDEDGEQIDHVGRSNRTQNPRLNFLNTLPPSEHLAAIQKETARRDRIYALLGRNAATLPLQQLFHLDFQLRSYDAAPDVMVFTTRFPPGYPNGRRLTDDVAKLTCDIGDCALIELSYTDSPKFPRQTVNDKPFLDTFPYLADPWPSKPQQPAPGNTGLWLVLLGIVLVIALVLWLLARWCRRRRRPVPAPAPA